MGRHALILGLTGGYCAGKTSAAAILNEEGFSVINVDAMGHKALNEALRDVAALLGPSVIRADGTPDRKAIGKIVFADKMLLARYEAIVHPVMNRLVDEEIQARRAAGNICVDAALLYKLPVAELCDVILEVRAPLCLRIQRGRERDGLSVMAIVRRVWAQRSLWKAAARFSRIIHIVTNAGNKDALRSDIRGIISAAGNGAS